MQKTFEKRKSPIMGWASWNNYRININEVLLEKQAKALVDTGLAKVGYTYFNIDDGFFAGRDAHGKIQAHPKRFPHGMKAMADFIHSLGLKAGIYSDVGKNTCAHIYDNPDHNVDGVGVGLYGHDKEDLYMYLFEWDYDFIKVDWCGGLSMGLDEKQRYQTIGKIIEEIRQVKGRDIIYNICRWQFPGEWVVDTADSWRIFADIDLSFESILKQIDAVKPLAKYHGPGHVNDLDMLQIGRGLSYEEDKTHFAMWCMMSTPLMLGNDLTTISKETLRILKNKELIAINQDPGCRMAYLALREGDIEYWVKNLGHLESEKQAIAILNRGEKEVEVEIPWKDLECKNISRLHDVWEGIEIKDLSTYKVNIPKHGTQVFVIQ